MYVQLVSYQTKLGGPFKIGIAFMDHPQVYSVAFILDKKGKKVSPRSVYDYQIINMCPDQPLTTIKFPARDIP